MVVNRMRKTITSLSSSKRKHSDWGISAEILRNFRYLVKHGNLLMWITNLKQNEYQEKHQRQIIKASRDKDS